MAIYRLVLALALPALVLATLVGRWRGRLPPGALAERLGRVAPPPSGAGARLWLHGASLGELTSARWIVARLLAGHPGLAVLVTANSAAGRAMVAGWGLAGVTAAFAPFDTGGAAARLLALWRPGALIVVENELWPARMAAARRQGVPVIVVGARMSARSAARWQRVGAGILRRLLGGLRFVSAQDAGTEARLVALGLPPDRIGPRLDLKAMAVAAPAGPVTAPPVARARCLLAASTHAGEEGPILDAFTAARAAGAFDLLILAPRHPDRAGEIAALITARGLPFGRRSAGAMPVAGQPVFLADTLGEMATWYGMAGATVIGGTFADRGGHTPYEPAAQGSAILHGPSIRNFEAPFRRLAAAGGAVAVEDAAALGPALVALTPQVQARLSAAAAAALAPAGDAGALIAAIVRIAGLGPQEAP